MYYREDYYQKERKQDSSGDINNNRSMLSHSQPAGRPINRSSGPSWSSPFLERLNSFFDFSSSTSPPARSTDYDQFIDHSSRSPPASYPSSSFPPSTRSNNKRLYVSSPDLRVRERRYVTEESKDDEEGSPGTRRKDRQERCLTLAREGQVLLAPNTDRRWLTFIALLDCRDNDDSHAKIRRWARAQVPCEIRGYYWKTVSGAKECLNKNAGFYQVLLTKESQSEYKIQKDIHRTLPEISFFREQDGLGQKMLYNILKAYAVMDQGLGYCQSMSYVAAILLLHLEEEEAFWVLCQLIKSYGMSGFFKKGLPSLKLSLYQLDKLTEQQLPRLALHFKREGVLPLLYASEWFSTLFVYNFPLDVVGRLWDIFFVEGVEYLFKVALALLTISEQELLLLPFEGIVKFLKDKDRYSEELNAETLIRVADSMWFVDKEALERLEERYNNPTTSIFRIE